MNRKRLLLAVALLLAFGGVLAPFLAMPLGQLPTPAAWKPQPDQIPFGVVLQGSRVEFSAGVFSGQKPSPPPTFLGSLPSWLGSALERGHFRVQSMFAKRAWRATVIAPAWLELDRPRLDFHSSRGPFVELRGKANTDQPGTFTGVIQLTVKGRRQAPQIIDIPVRVAVLPVEQSTPLRVLIAETPFDLYSLEDGRGFEPLAEVLGPLARRNVRVDMLRDLPASLEGYDLVLIAGVSLVDLSPGQTQEVRKFLDRGGKLALAADAFFVGTATKANTLMNGWGLTMENQDAGARITNAVVQADHLTAGIEQVEFWRPARILATGTGDTRLLATEAAGPGGFVAVARRSGHGEVRVLAQSLWWHWFAGNATNTDNARFLERLLDPADGPR